MAIKSNMTKAFKGKSALRAQCMADGGEPLDYAALNAKIDAMNAQTSAIPHGTAPSPTSVATPTPVTTTQPTGIISTGQNNMHAYNNATADAIRAQGLATGGEVKGPGGPTDDKIPTMLSNGEYVLPADTVDHLGKDKLDMIRAMTHEPVVTAPSGGSTNLLQMMAGKPTIRMANGGDPNSTEDDMQRAIQNSTTPSPIRGAVSPAPVGIAQTPVANMASYAPTQATTAPANPTIEPRTDPSQAERNAIREANQSMVQYGATPTPKALINESGDPSQVIRGKYNPANDNTANGLQPTRMNDFTGAGTPQTAAEKAADDANVAHNNNAMREFLANNQPTPTPTGGQVTFIPSGNNKDPIQAQIDAIRTRDMGSQYHNKNQQLINDLVGKQVENQTNQLRNATEIRAQNLQAQNAAAERSNQLGIASMNNQREFSIANRNYQRENMKQGLDQIDNYAKQIYPDDKNPDHVANRGYFQQMISQTPDLLKAVTQGSPADAKAAVAQAQNAMPEYIARLKAGLTNPTGASVPGTGVIRDAKFSDKASALSNSGFWNAADSVAPNFPWNPGANKVLQRPDGSVIKLDDGSFTNDQILRMMKENKVQ